MRALGETVSFPKLVDVCPVSGIASQSTFCHATKRWGNYYRRVISSFGKALRKRRISLFLDAACLAGQLDARKRIMNEKNDGSAPNTTGLSRRNFIVSGMAGAGAMLVSSKASALLHSPSTYRKAIIIGSGFGGAITALRLAERGVETLLIEKGKRWEVTPAGDTFSRYIYPDGRSTWLSNFTVVPLGPPLPINRFVGVLEGQDLGGLRIVSGSCYGGGSIVYGGLHVKPRKNLFEQVFPSEIAYDELESYYSRVGAKLGISAMPEDVYQSKYYSHYRVVEAQSRQSGLGVERIQSASDWDIVRQEIAGKIRPSTIHGEAIYGVNSGAKKSLDTNYLLEAERSGYLEVKTLHHVTDIGARLDGKYEVHVEAIDVEGDVIDRKTYICDYLFLAGGTIGTTNLLVKAKAKALLPRLNDEVGKGFGNNGNVYGLRSDLAQPTGQWQGGPPAIGIQDYDNPICPLFIEHPQLPLGLDSRSLLYFGVGMNATRGQFSYNARHDKAELDWPRQNNQQNRVNEALLYTLRKFNRDNGGVINPLLFGLKGYKDDAVYHPLGGAVIGQASDFFGRVNNYQNLYVMDGSLIPGSTACANPAFTIAALVERNMDRVVSEDF